MRALIPTVCILAVPFVPQSEREPPVPREDAPAAEARSDGLSAEDWAGIRAACRAGSPIAQQAYLKASNPGYKDEFGWRVAVSGDTVVVGAPFEDSAATGVNGHQGNDNAGWSGAAYVFVRCNGTWSQQAYLKASNTDVNDFFGCSVAISGETIVVGAYGEASSATGVNGDQVDDSAGNSGAAYVFVRLGTRWRQQAYLKASNTGAGDLFGVSVAISGDTVVIGAYQEDSATTGVNGDQDDNSARDAGAAYVFVRTGTSWSQQAYLKASNTYGLTHFGSSVAVSGNTAVVGSSWERQIASLSGAAYVFVRNGKTWTQQAYLKASNPDWNDYFGTSVAVSGDTVVVGAFGEDSNATGVNGDQNNGGAENSGAAYVFVRSGERWRQQAYLKASNTGRLDELGVGVAVSGDWIVVGAWEEDSNATGVNGNQSNNQAYDAGAAYLFFRRGTDWIQHSYLKASNTDRWDRYGMGVAISDEKVVIGAFREDSDAPGVNGDQHSDPATNHNSGAAYVFSLCEGHQQSVETARLGNPPNPNAFLPGLSGGPVVGTSWDPWIDHSSFAPWALVDFVAVSTQGAANVPTPLGTLLIGLPIEKPLRVNLVPGTPFDIAVPRDCALVGKRAWAQGGSFSLWGIGIELTNALDLEIGTY